MKRLQKQLSLQWRLTAFIALFVILPVTLLAWFSFARVQDAMHSKVSAYSAELMKVLGENIEREARAIENIVIDISYSGRVQEMVFEYDRLSKNERLLLTQQIRQEIALKASHYREISDIVAFLPDGRSTVLYGESGYRFMLEEPSEREFLRQVSQNEPLMIVRPFTCNQQLKNLRYQLDNEKGINSFLAMGRKINALEGGAASGSIMVRLNENVLLGAINDIDVGSGSIVVVANEQNCIMASTDKALFPIAASLDTAVSGGAADTAGAADINGSKYVMVKRGTEELGWSTVCFIPYAYLDVETHVIRQGMLITMCALFAAAMACLGILFRSVSKPINAIVAAMKRVEGGELDVYVDNVSGDEIGQVARSFNGMIAQIRVLLQNVKQKEKQKRRAELAALQAQINPHFLSNTLGTVKLLAHNQKADNIEELLGSLITLLRVSMDIKSDLTTVNDEIENVKCYIDIMRYRDYRDFSVAYEIQEDVRDSRVPKLILQPIVENALIHGIQGREGGGQILIRAASGEGRLYMTITDDGEGIPPEKLGSLLTEKQNDTRSRFSGIGLANVNERIKLNFGDEYGLFIESIYGMYTSVEAVLPDIKEGGAK